MNSNPKLLCAIAAILGDAAAGLAHAATAADTTDAEKDWKNTLVEFFDPQQGFGNLTFVTKGPNYRVRGGELQVIACLGRASAQG